MSQITEDATIGKIVRLKGDQAAMLLDLVLCESVNNGDEKRSCCPGVTQQLGFVVRRRYKDKEGNETEKILAVLLTILNGLPNEA